MHSMPRLAIGSLQPQSSCEVLTWALLSLLQEQAGRVQHFHSQARFHPLEGAMSATGAVSRHLDSWLMSPDVCREVFARNARTAAISVVEGSFAKAATGGSEAIAGGELSDGAEENFAPGPGCQRERPPPEGGRLEPLCQWLLAPRLGVLDVSRLADCRLPPRPAVDALLLDNVVDSQDFYRRQAFLEALWGLPVVGGLEALPQLRQAAIAGIGRSGPSADVCRELGRRLTSLTPAAPLLQLGSRSALPGFRPQLFGSAVGCRPAERTRVALAFDDAFQCYFSDALDLLELRGAEIVDFSPLKDDKLPDGVDIVYLGCGRLTDHLDALSANSCLLAALRNHVCSGKRIYAEGGGVAYLCQRARLADGREAAMAGILPATASLESDPPPPRPVELALRCDCWLGRREAPLRGYLNGHWRLAPSGRIQPLAVEPAAPPRLIARHHALGSLVHLNFALLPQALGGFLRSHAPCLDCR